LPVGAHVSESICNIQIVEFGIRVPLSDGSSFVIIADVEKRKIEGYGYGIAFVGAGVGCPALNGEVRLQGWDINLLDVSAGVDEEDLRCSCRWGESIYAFLNGGERAWREWICSIDDNCSSGSRSVYPRGS
jgi:hypothetical protein